ncbi:hypothetical protein G9A89_017602 [Geosiphon pyriformis]|nr:hypothetical protein G9A89_017602 [Geosiphon pyriformis]
MYSVDLPTVVTHVKNFEAAKLEANHAQAVNLVMNELSDLDSKLKQFIPNSELLLKSKSISIYLSANNAAANLSNTSISILNISTAATRNISTAATNSLSTITINSNTTTKPNYDNIWKLQIQKTGYNQNLSFQNYLSLLITPENAASSKQETNQKPLTCNISPAASTEDESLAAIFPFELEEITSVPLFSGATLDTKLITVMYTDAKVDAGSIITKQLMDQLGYQVNRAASTRIITANGATKTSIGEIDDFSFKVNGIIVPIKILVMEATQYQALVGNDWLTKTNAILD